MPIDWTKTTPDVKERVVSEGFAYLDGQLKLATSADQRASVLAGVFTTAATAVLAGLVALSTASSPSPIEKMAVYIGGGVTVTLFFAATGLAIAAIFPVGFWLPGNEPSSWYRDVETAKPLASALGEEAEHIQSKIDENRDVLGKNASRFKWAAIIGIAAPLAGFVFWAVSLFLLSLCRT